jgi:hypothetical protein
LKERILLENLSLEEVGPKVRHMVKIEAKNDPNERDGNELSS